MERRIGLLEAAGHCNQNHQETGAPHIPPREVGRSSRRIAIRASVNQAIGRLISDASDSDDGSPHRPLQGPRSLTLAAPIRRRLTFQCNDLYPGSEQRDEVIGYFSTRTGDGDQQGQSINMRLFTAFGWIACSFSTQMSIGQADFGKYYCDGLPVHLNSAVRLRDHGWVVFGLDCNCFETLSNSSP